MEAVYRIRNESSPDCKVGNTREKESHTILPHTNSTQWHAWIAFSQENPWMKKRDLSDSVYLGIV